MVVSRPFLNLAHEPFKTMSHSSMMEVSTKGQTKKQTTNPGEGGGWALTPHLGRYVSQKSEKMGALELARA